MSVYNIELRDEHYDHKNINDQIIELGELRGLIEGSQDYSFFEKNKKPILAIFFAVFLIFIISIILIIRIKMT